MKGIKVFLLILGLALITYAKPITTSASPKTEVDINITKSTDVPDNTKKDPIYTPTKSTPANILPQTGEILTSFLFIILGLSILLFIIGIVINKDNSVNVKWGY